jgi:transposase-like protein
MPRRYPPEVRCQVVELARVGTRVKQLAATFGMGEAAICLWLEQEPIDRGEIAGQSTDQEMELAAAKRRIVSSRPSLRSKKGQ